MLEKIRSTMEASGQIGDWYALYQQQPRPAEGIFFAASDFKLVDREKMPKNLRWCRYLDLALGQKKTSDWNTSLGVAVDNDGNVWLRDMIRVHELVEFLARIETVMVSDLEKGTMWGVEDVAFQALVFKDLTRKPELTNVAIYSIKPVGDKVARARPLQARGKAGKIFVVNGPWVETFMLEALDFPNGQHDDQIDTASGGLEMAAKRFALSGQLFY
jgi:predicted phage terminase large subunit-like protein